MCACGEWGKFMRLFCFLVVFLSPVMQSRDPSTNVVLLEDAAAVIGVTMAAACMGLTSLTGRKTKCFLCMQSSSKKNVSVSSARELLVVMQSYS